MLLVVSLWDVNKVPELSRWLEDDAPLREGETDGTGVGSLRDLTNPEDHHWGGWKNPECNVFGAALNHADLDAVIQRVADIHWKHPEAIQLLLMDQEESYFRLWMLREGQMRQYSPPASGADDGAY
jgi:hypothetical protein